MSSVPDPYREWDAAYVLGSLSPVERHAYEEHLVTCASCATAVSELAGISGVLRAVPDHRAIELLQAEGGASRAMPAEGETIPMPANLLRSFVHAAQREQTRARARTAAWIGAGLAAAAAAVLVIALAIGVIGSSDDAGRHLAMSQTAPGPITADVTLTAEAWGTTIQLECSYARIFNGRELQGSSEYALYVIDQSGTESDQATWEATPGSTVNPTATTALEIGEIQRLEVRWVETGRVVLEATP